MRGDRSGKASVDVIFEGRLKDSRREARGSPIPALLCHSLPMGHLSTVPGSAFLSRPEPNHFSAPLPSPTWAPSCHPQSPFPQPLSTQQPEGCFMEVRWHPAPVVQGLLERKFQGAWGRGWEAVGISGFEVRFCQFDSCDSGKFFWVSLSLSICEMGTTTPTLT